MYSDKEIIDTFQQLVDEGLFEVAGTDPESGQPMYRFTMKARIQDSVFFCPACKGPTNITEVKAVEGTIGDEVVTHRRVHLECPTCPDVFWFTVDIPPDPEEDRK